MKRIIGMGNALVDIMTILEDDDTLKHFGLPKGSMQLVDKDFSNKVLSGTKELLKTQSSGGSAANTIHGLARLGLPASFIGKVGKDDLGKFFSQDLINSNIKPEMILSNSESGRAIALVSKDSERTFATFLGAAMEMNASDITEQTFQGYSVFHVEGYLVQNHELIEKALRLAKKSGLTTSLDMASYNVVESNRDFLLHIIKNYVDIVFANEEEAKAFTSKGPEESLEILAAISAIAVVKLGEHGSLVRRGDEIVKIGVFPVKAIDTTGAGDLYASGFLYGLIMNCPLCVCGEIGALLSAHVIEVLGAKIPDDKWDMILQKVKELKE